MAGVQPPRGEACLPWGSGGFAPCRGAALGGGRDAGGEAAKRPFSFAPSGGLLIPPRSPGRKVVHSPLGLDKD